MKMKHIAAQPGAIALITASISLQAQPTNRMLYNFDTDQVSEATSN